MSAGQTNSNASLVARIALWSGRHRKRVGFAWLAIVVAALVSCSIVAVDTDLDQEVPGQAGEAIKLFDERFGLDSAVANITTTEFLTFSSSTLTVEDPAFRLAVEDLLEELSQLRSTATTANGDTEVSTSTRIVVGTTTHYDLGLPREASPFVSANGSGGDVMFLLIEIDGTAEDAAEIIEPVLAAVSAANEGTNDFEILIGGPASLQLQLSEIIDEDFARALTLNLPITFIILILALGALLAAFTPLGLALAAIITANGILALISHLMPLSEIYIEMVLLMGLATGIDYALFVITRYRRERRAGHTNENALLIASGTSGKAVIFAGVTVMLAISGMFLVGDAIFTSLALAAIVVVAVAVLMSVTLLPALILMLGDNIDRFKVPFIRPGGGESGGIWGAITDRVLARPALLATVTAGGLLIVAYPLLTLNLGFNGVKSFSEDAEGTKALAVLEDSFTLGLVQPAVIVVDAGEHENIFAADIQAHVQQVLDLVEAESTATGNPDAAYGPIAQAPDFNDAADTEAIFIPINADSGDDKALDAVKRLRDDLIPAAFGDSPARALVTGQTAANIDFRENIIVKTPIVFAFVLGLAFLILLVMFRSIVIPVKAIILNLLSVGAAYGVLVLVFQEGWLLEGLLSFEATGIVESWLPLFLFAILFGLSMDYHMFVLGRIKEEYEKGASNDEAVSIGIKATAATITSAAAIMVGVFSIFAFTRDIGLQQFGVGLAVAIFVDATLIRSILLPASMKLLGDANWYLPSWLAWIPEIKMEESISSLPQPTQGND